MKFSEARTFDLPLIRFRFLFCRFCEGDTSGHQNFESESEDPTSSSTGTQWIILWLISRNAFPLVRT